MTFLEAKQYLSDGEPLTRYVTYDGNPHPPRFLTISGVQCHNYHGQFHEDRQNYNQADSADWFVCDRDGNPLASSV